MKVVINSCYGGFSLSIKAAYWLYDHGMLDLACPVDEYFGLNEKRAQEELEKWRNYLNDKEASSFLVTPFTRDQTMVLCLHHDIKRNDPLLIACVEELGEKASGHCADLRIVEIPNDVDWEIDEYDGLEHVEERHRTWS